MQDGVGGDVGIAHNITTPIPLLCARTPPDGLAQRTSPRIHAAYTRVGPGNLRKSARSAVAHAAQLREAAAAAAPRPKPARRPRPEGTEARMPTQAEARATRAKGEMAGEVA